MNTIQTAERTAPCPRTERAIPLPNGLVFHWTSHEMLYCAKYLFREIFTQQRYYREGFEIRPNDTVVDIGANMGMFTLWAAPQACTGQVLAVEPARQPFECLQFNVAQNRLANVAVRQDAVGERGVQLEMVEYPKLNMVSHQASCRPPLVTRLWNRYSRTSEIRTTSVCVSLDDLMDDYGLDAINYLKIDCEGGEYAILRNLPARYWDRIERISLEFHELCPQQKRQELVSCMRKQGFQVTVHTSFLNYLLFKTGEIWAHRPGQNTT